MSEVWRAMAALMPSRRFRLVRAPLPVEGSCEVVGCFRFGLPWPWEVSEENLDLEGAGPVAHPLAVVAAPRTDGDVTLGLWSEQGDLDLVLPGVGMRLAGLHGGTLREERRVLLGLRRAVLVSIDEGASRHWRLVAEWRSGLVHGQMTVPLAQGEGYAPHLDTMLGTWEWV